VHRIKPLVAYGNAPLIPSTAGVEGFDVVHLHYPYIFGAELTLLARLRRRRRNQALLVHYKNRLKGKGIRGALFELYEHSIGPAVIRAADRICVLSPDHLASVPYLRRLSARDPERLIVLPNGVDADEFAPGPDTESVRARLGIAEDAVVCVFVGTLDRAHHFKRVDVAIDAMAAVGDAGVHLVVAGGGELLNGFRRRAQAAGVGDRTHFLGTVPHSELPSVLRACDISVLTTEPPESFGIVLIEAMACGLPVVATDYPGVRAIVDEGRTGILVPAGDARGVAAAISQLVLDAGRRREMGEQGRSRAVSEWSWPSLTTRMCRAYAEALAVRDSRSSARPRPDR
jgi:glycosyltransferase involved in cell wall biosynthesis